MQNKEQKATSFSSYFEDCETSSYLKVAYFQTPFNKALEFLH